MAVLAPETVARLGRLRLALHRRVDGRYAGGHRALGLGSSLDFADYREYSPGDDPRLLDHHAYARLGRRLIRRYTAEDTAALRIVLDASASMGFGNKFRVAAEVTAALVVIAAAGGDRARVLLAADQLQVGPWYAGPAALPAVEARLSAVRPAAGSVDLATALRRAVTEGPRGPRVLVSDLLTEEWEDTVRRLGSAPGDSVLVHILAREEVEPSVRGDVRLTDSETGVAVELAVAEDTLLRYEDALADWLDEVQRACGARGVAYARLVDDGSVEDLVAVDLARLGLVA